MNRPPVPAATTTDRVTVAIHDLGGKGPLVVMAHATGFHGRVFSPMAGALGRSFHCVSYDSRGHGDSGVPVDGDYDWHGFARDVLAVVGALEACRQDGAGGEAAGIRAVGHSSGAAALLLAEEARPGTFSALYLWEPVMFPAENPIGRTAGNVLSEGARRRREEFDSYDAAYENFSAKGPFSGLDPAALRAYVDGGFAEMPGGGVRLKCRRETEALIYEHGAAHDALAHLDEVACPVTVACGERTDAFGPLVIRAFADRLPDGRAVVLDGLGHFGPLEDPVAVAASVADAFGT